MRGYELLEKMELIDPVYVEAADVMPEKKSVWKKWSAIAACLCLVAVGIFFALRQNITSNTASNLQKIEISELAAEGMGFEGYMYYSAEELDNDNPWSEECQITSLPVYLNKAYDSSGAGIPKGLSKKEMQSVLDDTADALGAQITSTKIIGEVEADEDGNDSQITEINAMTNEGQINVRADGSIDYELPDDGLALPDEYSFTCNNTTYKEAQKTIKYLSTFYSKLLHMKNPIAVTWGDYDFSGKYDRRYMVYDSCQNAVGDILNYNLNSVSFIPNEEGKLSIIRINNALTLTEKVGDYPIISAKEAKQRLLAGNYQTSVPYAMPEEKYIAKVELVYRTGRLEKMLIPYYRFYVLLPDEKQDNGLETYGAYYVPAITDKYIEKMPVNKDF